MQTLCLGPQELISKSKFRKRTKVNNKNNNNNSRSFAFWYCLVTLKRTDRQPGKKTKSENIHFMHKMKSIQMKWSNIHTHLHHISTERPTIVAPEKCQAILCQLLTQQQSSSHQLSCRFCSSLNFLVLHLLLARVSFVFLLFLFQECYYLNMRLSDSATFFFRKFS
ncbi:hypothetical protein FF38_00169 [Lucilia cuprina]|uniref:Uncharacterized protein n=1 Tax=Lucilia cuprina TaxID=7375 RepID=A0A0L0BR81_LUCCU|nr:hypothetical protein FF38_00169 [Lucilia cuprina]